MIPRRLIRAAFATALCASAVSCSSFEKRVVAVEARQVSLEAQIADLQTAQQNIVGRLVQVRQELDNALLPLRTQSADRGEDFRSIQREFTALEDRYAELDSRLGRLTEEMARLQSAPTAAREVGSAMPPARGSAGAPTRPVLPDAAASSTAATLYNSAFNDYVRDNFALCVQGFEEYIRRFANSARAAEARYWIGQCHLSSGDTGAARAAFQTLIREHPNSPQVPDAIFNDALALMQEGREGAAAEAWRRLIRAYGSSDAAFLACNELGKLGAERPSSCEQDQN